MLEPPNLQQHTVFSEELLAFTEEEVVTVVQRDFHEARVDEELDRWLTIQAGFRSWSRNLSQLSRTGSGSILRTTIAFCLLPHGFYLRSRVPPHRFNEILESQECWLQVIIQASRSTTSTCARFSTGTAGSSMLPLARDCEVKESIPANVLAALNSQAIDAPFSAEWESEMASCVFDSG